MQEKYLDIVAHYESCLAKYGDSHKGVDWPDPDDAQLRYKVMLELIKENSEVSLLDFGCGVGHLYNYILARGVKGITYSGLDVSEKFIAVARQKFPDIQFYLGDILKDKLKVPAYDYIIMNGVFTEKCNLSFEEMFLYFQHVILKVKSVAAKGFAFNVMSKQVDWEREDLFHLPFDLLATFLTKEVSRHFVIRHDYGLYEYTVYVYLSANR